jgi:hypothetical protein
LNSRSASPNNDFNNDIANLSLEDSAQVPNAYESSIVVGLRHAVKIDRSLTTADVTGRPSNNELKDLALVPIVSTKDRAVSSPSCLLFSGLILIIFVNNNVEICDKGNIQ